MSNYVSGQMILKMREQKGLSRAELASELGVYESAVTSWEQGNSYPDAMLIEPLARLFGENPEELWPGFMSFAPETSSLLGELAFFVCPLCGNIVVGAKDSYVECCGLVLKPCEYEQPNAKHNITLERIGEGNHRVTVNHGMSQAHYISCVIGVGASSYQMVRFDHEGAPQAILTIPDLKVVYFYCNKHGMFVTPVNTE